MNVVDLMALQPQTEHPHGLEDQDFDALFTRDKPVIFAFHGYPRVIHWLTYRRHNHDNFHVRGYKEEGTTTTPFDMVVLNNLDRYQLALDAISRIPRLQSTKEGRNRPLLEHDGASQALRQRTRRGHARGAELALDLISRMTSAAPRSTVLALNSGSSSLKFGLYRIEASIPKVLLSGEVESIGEHQSRFWVKDENDKPLVSESANFGTQRDAVARIGAFLADSEETQPVAIGHRVVHGGPNVRRHCLIADGQKVLLAVKAMGGESSEAWRAVLDDLIRRGPRQSEFLIVDGAPGLENVIAAVWDGVPVQRCTVHKQRNLLAHAPERLHEEVSADYKDMMYAATRKEAETRHKAFIRKWRLKHRAVADKPAGSRRPAVHLHAAAAEPMEERPHHQRHRAAARGVQATDQDAHCAAIGGHCGDVVLGLARFQHAQGRWLANARHQAHRSAN